jgi:hypothetical protein
MCFCFTDLFEGNFIFTGSGNLHIVDYYHTSFLLTSFITYTLNQPRPICAAIKDEFKLPQKCLTAMKVAGYYFMISSRSLGRRSYGYSIATLTNDIQGLNVDRGKLKVERRERSAKD